jgi:transposase-like protein
MEAGRFERLKGRLPHQLTPEQCVELVGVLRASAHERLGELAVQRRTQMVREARRCPHCGGTDIVGHGRDRAGRARFRCRISADVSAGCGKTFSPLTGTPLARMRQPGKWLAYASTMGEHLSIADTAEAVGVAPATAFAWRHRLLAHQAARRQPQLSGVVEADETFFRTSYKGHRGWKLGQAPENRPPRYRGGRALKPGLSGEQVPVVTAVDRTGASVDVALRSRVGIDAALRGCIAPKSVVCSDGLAAYKAVAEEADSQHQRIAPPKAPDYIAKAKGTGPRKPGRLGLGRVNAHHARIKTAINRQSNGVSTKNLPNYLALLRARRRPSFTPSDLITDLLIHT